MAEEVAFEADVRAGGSAGGTVVTGASDMQADADALARVVDDLGEAALCARWLGVASCDAMQPEGAGEGGPGARALACA